jgi:hypothetical protein
MESEISVSPPPLRGVIRHPASALAAVILLATAAGTAYAQGGGGGSGDGDAGTTKPAVSSQGSISGSSGAELPASLLGAAVARVIGRGLRIGGVLADVILDDFGDALRKLHRWDPRRTDAVAIERLTS